MKEIKNMPGKILAAALLAGLILGLAACRPASPAATPTAVETAVPTAAPTAAPTLMYLEGAVTTDSGLQYLEITTGTGKAPETGDIITMHFIASLTDGTVLANTYSQGQPASAVWGAGRLLPGWEEGIGLMKEGGKATLLMPAELAFGAQGTSTIPPNSQVMFEVELIKVAKAPVPSTVTDDQLTTTDSGLKYYDLAAGQGAEAVEKGHVETLYVMWVKTGEGFDFIDQSEAGSPVPFIVGRGDVVFPGWEEGVKGMKVGGKRLLVIPPELAFGAAGSGVIPPNATLVMEIELTSASEPRLPTQIDEGKFTTTDSGLKYYDIKTGTGDSPAAGQIVVVHYTGWLEDGTEFDSSVDSGQPFSFQLGAGDVIPGWDEGVATMKVGGKRQLIVPASLAYGEAGAGNVIPPNATLIFEVELIEIQP